MVIECGFLLFSLIAVIIAEAVINFFRKL